MSKSPQKRVNITLLDDDVDLIKKIHAAVEKRLNMKLPLAFIVKLALREQACVEEIKQ